MAKFIMAGKDSCGCDVIINLDKVHEFRYHEIESVTQELTVVYGENDVTTFRGNEAIELWFELKKEQLE